MKNRILSKTLIFLCDLTGNVSDCIYKLADVFYYSGQKYCDHEYVEKKIPGNDSWVECKHCRKFKEWI